MNNALHERSGFIDGDAGDRAYEKYLERIRKGKNYIFYKRIADMLYEGGIKGGGERDDIAAIKDIILYVDRELNNRNAYRYGWYAANAEAAIELVLMETERRI